MTHAVAYQGRLPGLRVDPWLPLRLDDRIRLDVAAFVGFAERGPVDDPQPIEDPEQYTTVFGGDLPLAVDEHGVPGYAALPDAVRSFFDNGGRRVYVTRAVGRGAATLDAPLRVTSRRPLGGGVAISGVAAGSQPVTRLPAASPGGWARRMTVDVDVVDTVLALFTAADGTVDLAPTAKRALDEGDAVLVRRGSQWQLLWAPARPAVVAPPGGWHPGDVARLLRADLTVRMLDGDIATGVERLEGLRLGSGSGRTPGWIDVLQPAGGGFRRDRSMYLRAPHADALIPLLGRVDDPVPPVPTTVVPAECSRAALESDGLETFDPVAQFLDPELTGHTVEGLRLALEAIALDDERRPRGLHGIALQPEVALVAVPDLYHRPWTEQAVLVDGPPPEPTRPPPVPPVGFHACETEPVAPTGPPAPPAPTRAVQRMVVEPPSAYRSADLHAVAGALADLCAARADVVAVLGLPRHAGTAEAQHLADALAVRPAGVASYVGLWHPWGALVEQRSPSLSPLRPVPPDGAVTGVISATELARGWWVEPAGRRLAGFVSADLFDPLTTVDLFDRHLNVVRRRPAGFVSTSAHSLSTDPSLLQLSVRRLLIYVRRLAMREGVGYVFEPDDERFRKQVAATFVRSLERLRIEGALAAYQVEVESLTSRSPADEGRLRIDLKLAPTSPIEFITVTLLRGGDGLLQVTG